MGRCRRTRGKNALGQRKVRVRAGMGKR